jgi:hypothetical protein
MSTTDRAVAALPGDVARLLDGTELDDRVGVTVQLLTVDEGGWPRVALLSVGEVVALGPSALRLALWPGSHTTQNLTRTGVGTLALVHGGAAHAIAIEATRLPDLTEPSPRAVFDATVREHRSDQVPYATLTGGIAFELTDPASVLPRWRETVERLLAAGGAA